MKFDELDKKMRAFELSMDQIATPEVYIVVRLDGRGFTKLTKEILPLARPFDMRFRDTMIEVVKHLMDCGFKITYGYTQSDEISLLFDKGENGFGRKTRKIVSVLAGEASARFSLAMNTIGAFDCRIVPLPNSDLVVDYFRWRAEDANRNALNAYCYWKRRDSGVSLSVVTEQLRGMSVADKNELLFKQGINYNSIPSWQKRGVGFFYSPVDRQSINPKTNEEVVVCRNQLKMQEDLPKGENYNLMIRELLRTELK